MWTGHTNSDTCEACPFGWPKACLNTPGYYHAQASALGHPDYQGLYIKCQSCGEETGDCLAGLGDF